MFNVIRMAGLPSLSFKKFQILNQYVNLVILIAKTRTPFFPTLPPSIVSSKTSWHCSSLTQRMYLKDMPLFYILTKSYTSFPSKIDFGKLEFAGLLLVKGCHLISRSITRVFTICVGKVHDTFIPI